MNLKNLKSPLTLNFSLKAKKPLTLVIIAILAFSTAVSLIALNAINLSVGTESSYSSTGSSSMALHTEGKYLVDSAGNVVYLRGLQKVELADDPDGQWMGDQYWSDENVRIELQAMKSWGANTVRCIQSIDNWVYNLGAGSGYSSITNREAVQRLATIAAEEGMYVIFTAYRVTNYFNGGNQDPLPYPPYQTSAGASSVISSTQDFVDYWASVASIMKDYPNVLFEIWNEPCGDGTAMQTHLSVQQQVIDAIRATGATNIIMPQWDMGSWVNLDYPDSGGSKMDWITQANFNDPLNNLVYVTHIYREYGHTGIYSVSSSIAKWGTTHAYDYEELKRAFTAEKLDWVLNTLNKPVFVTECGANMEQTGAEANYEVQALNNELAIFNEWGINYIVHWWREIGIFRLHSGPPYFTPTAGGQVVQYQLQHQPTVPTLDTIDNTQSTDTNDSSTSSSSGSQANSLQTGDSLTVFYAVIAAIAMSALAIFALPSLAVKLRKRNIL